MSYSGSGNSGGAWRNDGGVPPHAFDPLAQPELFRGVLTRRVFAFLIDLVVLSIPVVLAYVFVAVFGLRHRVRSHSGGRQARREIGAGEAWHGRRA